MAGNANFFLVGITFYGAFLRQDITRVTNRKRYSGFLSLRAACENCVRLLLDKEKQKQKAMRGKGHILYP